MCFRIQPERTNVGADGGSIPVTRGVPTGELRILPAGDTTLGAGELDLVFVPNLNCHHGDWGKTIFVHQIEIKQLQGHGSTIKSGKTSATFGGELTHQASTGSAVFPSVQQQDARGPQSITVIGNHFGDRKSTRWLFPSLTAANDHAGSREVIPTDLKAVGVNRPCVEEASHGPIARFTLSSQWERPSGQVT